ncbi:hypothetical protein [Nocardia higoensis]|uniref:hypothetical protein n=1 Tax=Nocardia higoensis TaxID=228599 RepID=UPI0012F6D9EB|nr:hypothetical protein [Nocardia higoensis]
MTTIFCNQVLDVSHLLHIDRYAATFGVAFANGRKRADLIGQAPKGWVVAEAKGRSRAMEPKLRGKLIEQKRTVLSIEGAPPWLALGCVASFPNGDLVVDAFDPETPDENAIRLDDLTRDRYLYAYYLPFIEALGAGTYATGREAGTIHALDMPFEMSTFGDFGVQLGLLSGIAELTRETPANDPVGFGERVLEILDTAREREVVMFPDGSIFQTSWTNAIQAQDWLVE